MILFLLYRSDRDETDTEEQPQMKLAANLFENVDVQTLRDAHHKYLCQSINGKIIVRAKCKGVVSSEDIINSHLQLRYCEVMANTNTVLGKRVSVLCVTSSASTIN